jgi:mono/diheme cytochrome c family protein
VTEQAIDRSGDLMRELHSILGVACVALAATFPARPAAAGDPLAGEKLYVGARPLANGGAPCLACHALAGHGLAWNASFGPDLSHAAESYDEETLVGLLSDVPFPSMDPLYRARPITEAERADLAAFLLAARAPPAPGDARLALALQAGLGAAVLLVVLVLLARRRMPPVAVALARARRAEGGSP